MQQHDSNSTPGPAGEGQAPQQPQAAPAPDAVTAPDPQPTPPSLEIDALRAEVEKLKGQVSEMTDRLLRAHAEMDNVRKRSEREKADTSRYAITKFAHDIVNVADNFERAIQSVPAAVAEETPTVRSLLDGVTMTERELINVLERHGVKRIDPRGEAFNPHQHQAVMEIQNVEVAAGTVVQVYQCGYLIEDRVLRPAMVVVAKGGAKPGRTTAEPAGRPANDAPPAQGSGAAEQAGEADKTSSTGGA